MLRLIWKYYRELAACDLDIAHSIEDAQETIRLFQRLATGASNDEEGMEAEARMAETEAARLAEASVRRQQSQAFAHQAGRNRDARNQDRNSPGPTG